MTIAPKAAGPEAADATAVALARRERARAVCDAEPEASVVGLAAAALQGAPAVTQDVDLWFRGSSVTVQPSTAA